MDYEIDSLKGRMDDEAKACQTEAQDLRRKIDSKLESVLVGGTRSPAAGRDRIDYVADFTNSEPLHRVQRGE